MSLAPGKDNYFVHVLRQYRETACIFGHLIFGLDKVDKKLEPDSCTLTEEEFVIQLKINSKRDLKYAIAQQTPYFFSKTYFFWTAFLKVHEIF